MNLFADGVAVRQVGRETFRLARSYVDEMVLVDTDEICAAIKDIFEDTRTVLEPAGALALAGAKRWIARAAQWKGRTVVAVASGANMNFDRLRFVAERAELGEQREAVLAVTLPERPGAYRQLCALLGKRSVTEFNYRYAPGKRGARVPRRGGRRPRGDRSASSHCSSGTAFAPTTSPTTRWRSCTGATSWAAARASRCRRCSTASSSPSGRARS